MSLLPALALSAVLTQAPPTDEAPKRALTSFIADYETGPIYLFQNDGRYGANGTSYTAGEVGQQRNLAISQRLSAEARLGNHTFIALWAPLDLTTRTTLTRALTFQATTLPAGAVVDHRYLFDGYRLSYLYGFFQERPLKFNVGASVQVRNASVEFRSVDASPALFLVERDIGLVFALKARLRYDAGPIYAQADADFISTFGIGLAGQLHDVALTLGVPLTNSLDAFVRLRVVGGGADVPGRDIYNWGNFGTALVGVRVDLSRLGW